MYRATLKMLIVAAAGLVLACGSNVNPVAPEVGDLDVAATSANAKGGKSARSTFAVEVSIGGYLVGSVDNAVANSKESGFQGESMQLDLSMLLTPTGSNCADFASSADNGAVAGQFAAGASKSPRTAANFTFVWTSLFNFIINGVTHSLQLGPNEGPGIASIDDPNDWLPKAKGDVNRMSGSEILFQVNKGREKKDGCAGTVTQNWQVVATKN